MVEEAKPKMENRSRNPFGPMFYIVAVAFMISNSYVNSAPTPLLTNNSKNVTFWDFLYHNVSGHSCEFVPQFDSLYESSVRSSINTMCNATIGDPVDLKKSSSPLSSVCTSLQSVFPVLCNSSLNTPSSRLEVDTSVDLKEFNNVSGVCSTLKDIVQKISQSQAQDKSSKHGMTLFSTVDPECSTICRSIPNFAVEDIELQVNPACILLLKGYTIYEKLGEVNAANAMSPAVQSANLEKGDITVNSGLLQKDTPPIISTPEIVDVSTIPSQVVGGNVAKLAVDAQNKPSDTVKGKLKDAMQSETIKAIADTAASSPKSASAKSSSTLAGVHQSGTEPTPYKENVPVNSEKTHQDANALSGVKSEGAVNPQPSSKTSSTTVAAVDHGQNEFNDLPVPPIGNDKITVKSSTALPKTRDEEKQIIGSTSKGSPQLSVADVDEASPLPAIHKKPGEKPSSPKKIKEEDDNGMASVGEEEEEYDPDVDIGMGLKPPVNSKNEAIPIPPENSGLNFEEDASFKSSKSRFSNDGFSNGLPFESRGTTINVSLNETEDTGFFNYFLFCVTLVGLLYLVIHNKKKLIAYVVEGKRPRGRSASTGRRTSTGSQYRRLENNFD
ncbi:unnamed protein product [Orchesella dallaii]|uniref:Trans-Golgi network integral membrane protein 2 n=1 Tax=Orchesella dallaii TaxID=48710 RepID=A0ABP1QKR3_9HEXA